MTHILVLGAGYTGMMAALGAARRTRGGNVQVTLVNPSDTFTERLRMHQAAAGQQLQTFKIQDLLGGTGIKLLTGKATRIDADAKRVTVDGAEIAYDRLVYAIGSAPDTSPVPGATEHAHTLNSPALPGLLKSLRGTFVVCGAGLTGVEAATEIAESCPDIRVLLVSRGPVVSQMTGKARAHVFKAFERLGITVRTGVTVTEVRADGIVVDGEFVACEGTLWTTGVRVPVLAPAVTTDANGRMVVDPYLRSVSHPDIYAVGDAAAVTQPYGVMHGTCQGGIPTAVHAAETIARDLAGKPLRPFRFGYFHQPVSLGRHDAVIQFTHADDSPRRWFLRGRMAIWYKETVSSSPIPSFKLARRFRLPASMVTLSKGPRVSQGLGEGAVAAKLLPDAIGQDQRR